MINKSQLSEIFGVDKVSDDKAILEQYSRDISFVEGIRPAFVVKVTNSEQVTRLVKLAKETKTALVPISSGPPHFRGDTIPGTGGAVIVDLSEMKKIININRKHRVAMFEPGVTFGELTAAVVKEGMRLNMPLLPRKTKSVVGSMLEREPVVMPKYHWDIGDPIGSTEVIFGNGEMFRTGAAAGSGTIEEQWAAGGAQKEAAGPSGLSLYRLIQGSQGSMGIVTWATARLEILPKMEEPYFAGSAQLDKILDMVHWLVRLRLANECLVLNNTELALIMAASTGVDYFKVKEELPQWILFFNIAAYDYLTEERLKGQVEDMLEVSMKAGVDAIKAIGPISADDFLKIVQNPSVEPYWKLQRKGASESVMFLSIYDKIFDQIQVMNETATEAGYSASDIGVYIQPIVQGVNYHCEFDLFYDPAKLDEASMVRGLSAKATQRLMNQGAFFSRPYGECVDLIMNRDAASLNAMRKVKSILDPDNIMNPGKLCL